MYRQPADFPRADIPKLTVAGSPGFGNVSGEVSTALSSACRETDSRNDRRQEPRVSRRSPPFVTCFLTCFQEKPVLGTIGREEPRVSRRSSPVFLPFSIGTRFSEPTLAGEQGSPGACPELMIGQGGSPRRGCGRNGGGQGREPRIAPAAQLEPSIQGRYPDPGGPGGGLEGPAPAELGDHG